MQFNCFEFGSFKLRFAPQGLLVLQIIPPFATIFLGNMQF